MLFPGRGEQSFNNILRSRATGSFIELRWFGLGFQKQVTVKTGWNSHFEVVRGPERGFPSKWLGEPVGSYLSRAGHANKAGSCFVNFHFLFDSILSFHTHYADYTVTQSQNGNCKFEDKFHTNNPAIMQWEVSSMPKMKGWCWRTQKIDRVGVLDSRRKGTQWGRIWTRLSFPELTKDTNPKI